MKPVGILTYHRADNFGAVLQAAALQEAIRSVGGTSEILDYRCLKIEQEYHAAKRSTGPKSLLKRMLAEPYQQTTKEKFRRFREEHLTCSPTAYQKDTIKEAAQRYNIFLTGSDQVFDLVGSGFDSTYYLDIAGENISRYAYAASFGRFLENPAARSYAVKYLKDFRTIGVREEIAWQFLKELFPKKDIRQVLDPVFLPSDAFYRSVEKSCFTSRDYLLLFLFLETKEILKEARRLARNLHCRILFVTNAVLPPPFLHPVKGAGPRELIWLISHAKGVLTDSFHGTALSIRLKRPFLSVTRPNDPRIIGLLEKLRLQHGILHVGEKQSFCDPAAEETQKILKGWREESLAYLKEIVKDSAG